MDAADALAGIPLSQLGTGLSTYLLVVVGLLGLVFGSGLECLAGRIARGESWARGRSHCDACGHELAARDLVPVVSWLASHGRCRYCGAPIGWRCPACELGCCALFVATVARFGLGWQTVEALVLVSCLVVLSLTDMDDFLIPNGCVVTAAVARMCYLVATVALAGAGPEALWMPVVRAVIVAAGLVCLSLVMDRALGQESLGGGDVKLLAVAALWFDWPGILLVLVVACLLGIVQGLALQRRAADGQSRPFPWGPAIALAMWATLMWGDAFAGWYLGLFL